MSLILTISTADRARLLLREHAIPAITPCTTPRKIPTTIIITGILIILRLRTAILPGAEAGEDILRGLLPTNIRRRRTACLPIVRAVRP